MRPSTIFPIALSLFLVGCDARPAPVPEKQTEPSKHILYMDDIGHTRDGEAFESAFALDDFCHGLQFVRWNDGEDPKLLPVLQGPRWNVVYIVKDGDQGLHMIPHDFDGLQVSVQVKNA